MKRASVRACHVHCGRLTPLVAYLAGMCGEESAILHFPHLHGKRAQSLEQQTPCASTVLPRSSCSMTMQDKSVHK